MNSVYKIALAAVLVIAGCGGGQGGGDGGPLVQGQAFVPIARSLNAVPLQSLQASSTPPAGAGDSFYLAMSKKELGKRWFMSAYLQQLYPGGPASGAAMSLGVRVVTFRIQNGKLYVFDASDNYTQSTTFDPTLVIEAYPIIQDYAPFTSLSKANDYVLFDPAAGLNRFGIVSDAFSGDVYSPVAFQIDLTYSQNFRALDDGSAWEEVFSGTANVPIIYASGANPLKASGTLGLSFRRYRESKDYTPTPAPAMPYYFLSTPQAIPDTGDYREAANKWNIHKGMKPIRWLISGKVLTAQKKWPQYDLIGALKRGITNWNEVFGFEALQAEIASPTDSFSDDEKNYVIYDLDPSSGFAFADWRSNPNTGEIRGASIFFNDLWIAMADYEFDDAPASAPSASTPSKSSPASAKRAPKTHPKVAGLTWEPMGFKPRCVLWADHGGRAAARAERSATSTLTKKEKVERVVTHVLLHEVGHTLGLRHNFKGSLVPPSSSVMDYIVDEDVVNGLDHPAAYDRDAVRFLYGLGTELPKQPFCTDEWMASDPDCSPYDATPDPAQYFAALYAATMDQWLQAGLWNSDASDYDTNNLLKYVRAGAQGQTVPAWNHFIAPVRVPADPDKIAADPSYAIKLDMLVPYLFGLLYLDPLDFRGDIVQEPSDPDVIPLIVEQAKKNLLNEDKIRSFSTRRVIVDVLKKIQRSEALDALVDARQQIAATLGSLSGTELNETRDLLAKIDVATTPYFSASSSQ